MPIEIERKFLTQPNINWGDLAEGVVYKQGYLSTGGDDQATVRVRIAGDSAFLTIKGQTQGISRREFEYAIPVEDALVMLDEQCQKPLIEKIRYHIPHGDHVWEVDVFSGDNAGLVVAEIELASESEVFAKPDWLREEVSGDPKYYNSSLIKQPFNQWT